MFRQCPICRTMFFPKAKTQVYCGQICKRTAENRSEKARERKRRYEQKRGPRPGRRGGEKVYLPTMDRPFVAWDGEGYDGRYVLLANSRGEYIENPNGLRTVECLEFLLDHSDKKVNHVWFSFGYDVAMILGDLPFETESGKGCLRELWQKQETVWEGYWIRYIPRVKFQVSDTRDGRSYTGWDTYGFFQASFMAAVEEWLGEVPDIIRRGKESREEFASWDLADIREYNAEECRLLVELLEKLRDSLRAAGMKVESWHGAGAVASAWLKGHNAKRWYGKIPKDMIQPLACAYFGGRIDLAATGWGRIYHYDLNSAYPAAFCRVPNLAKLTWRHIKNPGLGELPDYSLVRVRWKLSPSDHGNLGQWNPLPWRSERGRIYYPYEGQGWYWTVEVRAAIRRFRHVRLPWIELLEAWVPEGEWEWPWKGPIEEAYRLRKEWKKAGNPAQYPIKLALNSLYGKTAQHVIERAGGRAQRPAYRNMAIAGYITAQVRAWISDGIGAAGGQVVCVMADSLWSLVPLHDRLPIGDGLGEWSYEPEDEYAAFAGAGVYETWTRDGQTRVFKERGYGGLQVSIKDVVRWWLGEGKPVDTSFKLRRFVGIGLALHSPDMYRPHFRRFVDMERSLLPVPAVGTTKRKPAQLGGVLRRARGGKWLWLEPWDRPEDEEDSYPYEPGLWELYADEEDRLERLAEECVDD